MLAIGGHGDNMSDEKKYNDFTKGPENVAKVIVFALVAIVLITSFALPVLASVGERSATMTNTGVRVSEITELGYEEKMEEFGDGATLVLSVHGLDIMDIHGVKPAVNLISSEDYDTDYPIAFTHTNTMNANIWKWTFDPETHKTTSISISQTSTASTHILSFPNGMWIQDPNGKHILSTGPVYASDPSSVIGYRIENGLVLAADTESAYLATGTGYPPTVSQGATTADMRSGDYYTINSISYENTTCAYYIGPISTTYSTNILEGTPVGAMIGTIPALILIGLVLYVARSMGRSDR